MMATSGTNGLTEPIDHVMLTAGGSYYATVGEMDVAQVRHAFEEHLVLPIQIARAAAAKMPPGRQELRETLPVRRVVEPSDIARLAVSLMSNTAVAGATYDIDGGQHLLGTP
jgi:hypothetical protein